MEFPKKYNFKDSEPKWQGFWYEQGVYDWDKNTPREHSFVIDTPPPTVSGQLHIGHVYSYTHTDFIARYKRMSGMNVFYPMGFDDNGLPTERLVEKKRKVKAVSMNREEFVAICKEVVESEEEKFRELFRSIALSVDWQLEYQTISPVSQKISQMSFLDLVEKDQVYRASEPILWDPVDQTALSQADIEDKERQSFMNDIEFRTEGGEQLKIATTRPELLPACVAVFYHPDDERYQHLEGKNAITPLFGVRVPILPDDLVNPEKGTGLVMCCTFGDQTDIMWWRKHNLPCKIILTKYGALKEIEFDDNCQDVNKAKEFATHIEGLKVKDARGKIIEILRDEQLLLDQTEIQQTVKCAERSGAPLEIITTPQWFVKTIDHSEAMMKRAKELNWHPQSMRIKLESWIQSLSWDWCISRQRYFGVPFPVWFSKRPGEEGRPIFASIDELPVDPMRATPKGYEAHEVEADIDVMDTWSTSSVTPQLSSHGISKMFMVDQKRHSQLFPADLRPQAHEIIRTWAFYTMLKAHLHQDSLPWKNIMISGWCLAEDRSKMSKSKGNVIVPEKLLEQHGSDVVRYWAASSKLGADTAYSEDVLKNGKRLVSKLWNASKFVSTHFDKLSDQDKKMSLNELEEAISSDYDKYFVSELKSMLDDVTSEYEKFEYANAMSRLEHFFWKDFCDNYLEITKTRAYNEDGSDNEGQRSVLVTLYHTMKILLKLFAPTLPHITEEIYQILYSQGESVHMQGGWPQLEQFVFASEASMNSKKLVEILDLVRKGKAADNLSIKAPIEVLEVSGTGPLSNSLVSDLKNVTNTETVAFVEMVSEKNKYEGESLTVSIEYTEI